MGVCFILMLDTVVQLGWLALHLSACFAYLRPDRTYFGTAHTSTSASLSI